MTISENEVFPRAGDTQTVYLKNVITDPNIVVGEYTMYNDFVHDPTMFEKNNVLYHYPINNDRLVIGKFCSSFYSIVQTISFHLFRHIHFHYFLMNGDLRKKRLPVHGIIKAIL